MLSLRARFLYGLLLAGGGSIGICLASWVLPLSIALAARGPRGIEDIPLEWHVFAHAPVFLEDATVRKAVDVCGLLLGLFGAYQGGMLGLRLWTRVVTRLGWMSQEDAERFERFERGGGDSLGVEQREVRPAWSTHRYQLTSLEVTLAVDIILVTTAAAGGILAVSGLSTPLASVFGLAAGIAAVIPFLTWRSRGRSADFRPASSSDFRRIAGLVLMGLGGTLTVFGVLFVAIAIFGPERFPTDEWLLLPASLLGFGNGGILLGAKVPTASE